MVGNKKQTERKWAKAKFNVSLDDEEQYWPFQKVSHKEAVLWDTYTQKDESNF